MKPERMRIGETLALTAVTTDVTPKWQKIFNAGRYFRRDMPGGSVLFDHNFFQAIVANWKKSGSPKLPFDYFHQGGSDVIAPLENKLAAGWMHDFKIESDGLYALTEWTDKARTHILNKELSKASPYFSLNGTDIKTGKPQGPTLRAVGLLNDPFLEDLPQVAASMDGLPTNQTKADEAKGMHMEKKLICAALGMPEDTADEAVLEQAKKCAAALTVAPKFAEQSEKLALTTKALDAKDEAIKFAQAESAKLSAKVTELETEKLETQVAGVVATLERGGHIIASQKDAVVKYAKATSADEALKFFSAFKAVALGEAGIPAKPEATDAKKEAELKLTRMAEEMAKTQAITFSAAWAIANRDNVELSNLAHE